MAYFAGEGEGVFRFYFDALYFRNKNNSKILVTAWILVEGKPCFGWVNTSLFTENLKNISTL